MPPTRYWYRLSGRSYADHGDPRAELSAIAATLGDQE